MSTIGRYELVELLGEGGMGAVWKARDPRFDRLVAVKVLHEQLRRSPEVVERFKSEAVIQAKLSHPHITAVYDFVADASSLAIVMELVEGETLAQRIERTGPQPLSFVVPVMRQALSALGYAHGSGLVHRDLKPSNVMVQEVGGEPYAKVMDFGIAKILGSEKVKTATEAKMGTLAYMSPEHVQSPKHVDARSDLYSLGVVLYELLTGRAPFEADTEYELMQAIVNRQPPPPSRCTAGLGQEVDAVLVRALAKDPVRRYSSAHAFTEALRELARAVPAPGATRGVQVGHRSPVAGEDGSLARSGRSLRGFPATRRASDGGGTAGGEMVAAGPAPPRRPPVSRRSGLPAGAWVALGSAGLAVALGVVWVVAADRLARDRDEAAAGVRWVQIPAGAFTMGCTPGDDECKEDEKPPRAVRVPRAFLMAQSEVTRSQYRRFTAATGRGMPIPPGFSQTDEHPVVNVSWHDAKSFCAWTGGRLPTEAEWEYAARGGSGSRYAWGDDPTPLVGGRRQANVADLSALRKNPGWAIFPGYDDGHPETSPVCAFGFSSRGSFGLCDTAGNVWEWVEDRYEESRRKGARVEGAAAGGAGGAWMAQDSASATLRVLSGPASGTLRLAARDLGDVRVLRGGSWKESPGGLRVSGRAWGPADLRSDDVGFRCVRAENP